LKVSFLSRQLKATATSALLLTFCNGAIAENIDYYDRCSDVNLETFCQDFVLETKRINIPFCPHAFNPSIVRWKDHYIMVFREIICASENQSLASNSRLSIVRMDNNFNIISAPQIIKGECQFPSRADDARLIAINDTLYMIYSDNLQPICDSAFRMQIVELFDDGETFFIIRQEELTTFDDEKPWKREKNWVPFIYNHELLLAYSLFPHKILYPLCDNSGRCRTYVTTYPSIVWEWGDLRGGTPAVLIDDNYYLGFFHSSKNMKSLHSNCLETLHYFMGAYLFESQPPFTIKKISPEPIVAENFYFGENYAPYWKPINAVFPCGIFCEDEYIWVSYGRQDHEMWLAKIDKRKLLDSLINVSQAKKSKKKCNK